jgi:hypothetical protein
MSIRWWEKTVEYEFVMSVSREQGLFLAPLDGEHEKAGDAVFSSDNRWVLIEFKKDEASVRTEKGKFVLYDEARNTGVPQTTLWRRGKKVKGNSILPGTAIATFPILSNGKFRFKGHAAIFVRYTAGGIEMYDQWKPSATNPVNNPGRRFSKRTITYDCSGYVSNDAEAFYVIELAEEPSNEPTMCSSTSFY